MSHIFLRTTLIFALIFTTPFVLQAQTSNTQIPVPTPSSVKTIPQNGTTIRERNQEARQQIPSEQEKIKNLREDRGERRHAVVRTRVENVVERMGAFIERLRGISERIDTRITKLGALGKDTSEAKTLLVTAEGKLDIAETSYQSLKDALGALQRSTGAMATESEVQAIKVTAKDTKRAINESYSALMEVVTALLPIRPTPSATPLPTMSEPVL